MTLCSFGPVPFGFTSLNGGLPALEAVTKRSSSRWADSEIFQNPPLSQFLGPALSEVNITLHFWEPYTLPLAVSTTLLGIFRDNGWPMPLWIGNQLMGNGISLFTIRSMEERWESIPSNVTKARVNVTFKEFVVSSLASNSLINIAGQALSTLGAGLGGISAGVSIGGGGVGVSVGVGP